MKYEIVSERTGADVRVSAPSDLMPCLRRYSSKKQEYFLLATLDGAQGLVKLHVVTIGILNRTLIHPREIFVRAIKDNACALILAHNHPSGDVRPSREDRAATERLVKAGNLIGIEVLDHLIIAKSGYYSFKEQGEIL